MLLLSCILHTDILTEILCHPLLLPSVLPSFSVFSNESVLYIRWPKYWGFSFCISPSNEYSGLIAYRIDWFDLLAVQGTLKSLLQHHDSKASILWHSAFCMVQLLHYIWLLHSFDYMGHMDVLLCLSKSFITVCIIFRSTIHLELNFVLQLSRKDQTRFFPCGYIIDPVLCIKDCPFLLQC